MEALLPSEMQRLEAPVLCRKVAEKLGRKRPSPLLQGSPNAWASGIVRAVASKSNEFLNTSKENSTTIFAIANWKFGGLMGGVVTSFTALYVVGYTLAFLKWLVESLVPRS